MSLDEFWLYSVGEFGDMIACYQVAQGIAELKDSIKETEYIPDWR